MNTSPIAGLGLIALVAFSLAGCEVAEESAQKLQEKAEQAVQELAREAVSDTVAAFNKQVDEVQQSAKELLGRQREKATFEKPEREGEAPALTDEAVET